MLQQNRGRLAKLNKNKQKNTIIEEKFDSLVNSA